jgi:SAM-dependent methyltransferase
MAPHHHDPAPDEAHHRHQPGGRPGPAHWDARYREGDRIWSGEPNHALVTEAAGLTVGRAIDVGCGEGADAVWLAREGWDVTGVDPSIVALDRARAAAVEAGVDITWHHGELTEVADRLADGSFELVLACYPTLYIDTDPLAILAALVAPGGSLLVVHHVDADGERVRSHDFDHDELLFPADVIAGLGGGWAVAVDERRPRVIRGGSGAHHADDHVVRVVRTADAVGSGARASATPAT